MLADVNHDGREDLFVAAPRFCSGDVIDRGAVHVYLSDTTKRVGMQQMRLLFHLS